MNRGLKVLTRRLTTKTKVNRGGGATTAAWPVQQNRIVQANTISSRSNQSLRSSAVGSLPAIARVFSASVAQPVEEDYPEEMDTAKTFDSSLVFVHNDRCVPFPYASKEEFLLKGNRGAYTTARSVDQNAVFEFEAHVERLAQTTRLMMEKEDAAQDIIAEHDDILKVENLKPKLIESIGEGMSVFRQNNEEGQEMKITVLMTWENQSYDIFTLVAPLGDRPVQPVKVEVGGKPRSNALAKDSEWTRQRRALEEQKPADVNEIILMDDSGSLYEGMQTNFYVVQDGCVRTADEGILEGTVRKMILEVCKREGVPLNFEPPNIHEIDAWDGIFISSTSRLLLPITEITYEVDGEKRKRIFEEDTLVSKLEKLILGEFRGLSTKVI